jgi:hypothetical protein
MVRPGGSTNPSSPPIRKTRTLRRYKAPARPPARCAGPSARSTVSSVSGSYCSRVGGWRHP